MSDLREPITRRRLVTLRGYVVHQFDPRPPRVGSVTQLTLARSAICCSTGVISLSTSGSTAPPAEADERAVGDQTIRAPAPELAPPSPPLLNSSCAAVDSVAGSEKESFSAPPSWLPSPTIAPSAITQAMSATTGRRIAHLERPGTKKTPQISSYQINQLNPLWAIYANWLE